jgi:hypothetical protein
MGISVCVGGGEMKKSNERRRKKPGGERETDTHTIELGFHSGNGETKHSFVSVPLLLLPS